ncbi:MAG: hypothetical protein FWD03_02955, partial [Defluviitaleaceae bacterium]|nr:hypothetical protein [Defluviitaleaceae bacterium]
MKKGICLVIIVLTLTGCWDRIEIEDRAFAVAFGVDAADEDDDNEGEARFQFSAAIARPDEESAGDEEDGESDSSTQGRTLIEAIYALDARCSRKLSFGQAKTVVLGRGLLEDRELFREAIGTIENRPEVDRTITVLAANGDVPDLLAASPHEGAKQGYYVVNFYRLAPKSGGRSFQKNFEKMMAELRATGNTLLPLVQKADDNIQVAGALAIKDYQLAGELDGAELRGLLWAEDRACKGAILTTEDNMPMVVRRHKSNVRFVEEAGHLRCIINVRVKGEVFSFGDEAPKALYYEQLIEQEIKTAAEKLQH